MIKKRTQENFGPQRADLYYYVLAFLCNVYIACSFSRNADQIIADFLQCDALKIILFHFASHANIL